MRLLFVAATIVAVTAAANATDWIAICYGQDAQYTQTINGAGYFHLGLGNGTYSTQKLHQIYYDGKLVCGAADTKTADNGQVAIVCADKTRKAITAMYKSDLKAGRSPKDAPIYCNARVTIHK